MKKANFKKITAIFIAMIMVLGLLPVSVFAEDALDLTADEIVINSVADWNVVATSGNTFEGKTVKLGADIDFNDATDVKPLFATFKGTFDGQGHTVKNATVDGCALIAVVAEGGMVKNVTAEKITIDAADASNGAIIVGQNKTAKTVIADCIVTDCTATLDGKSGLIMGSAGASVEITNCKVLGESKLDAMGWGADAAILGIVVEGCDAAVIDGCEVGADVVVTYKGIADLMETNRDGEGIGLVVGTLGCIQENKNINSSLKIVNCTVSGEVNVSFETGRNAAIGALAGTTGSKHADGVVMENNIVKDVTLQNGAALAFAIGKTGTTTGITIRNLTASGTLASSTAGGSYFVGGVIGNCFSFGATGPVVIENCMIDIDATNTCVNDKGVAGIIAHIKDQKPTSSGTIVYNISNCYVKGNLSQNRSDKKYPAAGVIGNMETANTVNIDSVILDVKLSAFGNKNMVYGSFTSCTPTINVTNCSTTENEYNKQEYTFATVTAEQIEKLVKTNAKGFVTSVAGHVNAGWYQVSDVEDGKYAIRFVATSLFEEGDVKLTVVATYTVEGQVMTKTFTTNCTVYDSLTGSDALGITAYTYDPADFGGAKFFAYTLTGVPMMEDCTFEVTASINGVNGATYQVKNPASAA